MNLCSTRLGDCEFINTREQIPQYDVDCYRKFIDKTRIERAQRLNQNDSGSEPVAKKPANVSISNRLQRRQVDSGQSRSIHVLPRICLICKKEDLTYTCPVSKMWG